MNERPKDPPGLIETFRELAVTVLAILQNRLELLLVELEEERVHILNALLLTSVIVVLGVFTLALAACALSILVWHEFGVNGLWVMSGMGLMATLLMYWRLRLRLKRWPMLPETLAQMKADRACWGES
jgi:uncharacterized membrane protein YqjE